MKSPEYPVTDDHIHLDPVRGRGIEAAKEFLRAGGTHIFLVTKLAPPCQRTEKRIEDYRALFDETIRIARSVREIGLSVFPIVGLHPEELMQLLEISSYDDAIALMKEGLDLAAEYVVSGEAVALKSGRPHYPVSHEIWDASNEILTYALDLAHDCGCALQIHAEMGPCHDIVEMAKRAGQPVDRVVKHYSDPETALHPSLIARHEAIPELIAAQRPFTLESDYIDENSRPGAVIGPRSVPRYTRRLLESGVMTQEDCYRIHSEIPSRVYGVSIHL